MAKHKLTPIFQTVNQAKVIWDPKVKSRGIFGGHLNIKSSLRKYDKIKALLLDSNLDFDAQVKAGSTAKFLSPSLMCLSINVLEKAEIL